VGSIDFTIFTIQFSRMIKRRSIIIQFFVTIVILLNYSAHSQGIVLSPGITVTTLSNTTLVVSDGDLLIQDDYSHAPSFLPKGPVSFVGTNSGEVYVEQYLTRDKYHLISSPVQSEVNGAYMWMYMFDWPEATGAWHDMGGTDLTISLNPGQGYMLWSTSTPVGSNPASADSAVLNGTLNLSNITPTLSVTAASSYSGWNLVGNPFSCALNWNGNAAWNLTNLDASIWIWDPVAGNYKTWNYNTSSGTLQSGAIASTQGFWVHASDTTGSTASSMTLPISQRVHSANSFYKNSISPNQLKLKVIGESPENDETIIGFWEGATLETNDLYDAQRLGGTETAPSLYTVIGGMRYAMKQLPNWIDYPQVPLSFSSKVDGSSNISTTGIESFPDDLPIFLRDNENHTFQDLRINSEYSFTSNTHDNSKRFTIFFSKPEDLGNSTKQVHIYSYKKTIYINLSDYSMETGECSIYDVIGRKILKKTVTYGMNKIETSFKEGVYVVSVTTNGEQFTEKVFVY